MSKSLSRLLDASKPEEVDFSKVNMQKLKAPIIEEISLLIDEVKNSYVHIAEQAGEHIFGKCVFVLVRLC